MAISKTILSENKDYWTGRACGYSEINQEELRTAQREVWRRELKTHIERQFPDRDASSVRVLEIGTGPGFFAILLCELGYDVTAIDLTPAMLSEARKNAGALASRIKFMEMNAEELYFLDHSFDVILSRNLTWNLPHPEAAYREWKRVLKPGGLLLNFDANWYHYLYDSEARAGYDADRVTSEECGIEDRNIGHNFEVMEEIAMRVPLSNIMRPAWDRAVLSKLGMEVSTDVRAWDRVWSAEEKVNFASTPMFLVHAVAGGAV
ncbi:MAG: class I SAM-dependent methyltransferase [Oscillospiraceae bacterium]|nr:class I SAM-dependent methyltransferase [Oscillospiraceae bacterium]